VLGHRSANKGCMGGTAGTWRSVPSARMGVAKRLLPRPCSTGKHQRESRKAAVPDDWTDCGCAAQKPLARGAVATAGPAWCLNGRAHFLIDDRDQCRTHGWCDSQRGGVIGETRRWARHSKQQCSQRVTLTLFCTRTHRGSAAAPNVVLTGIWTGADAPVLCLITSWTTGPPFGAYPQKPSECPFLALCVRLAHGIAKYSLLWSSE